MPAIRKPAKSATKAPQPKAKAKASPKPRTAQSTEPTFPARLARLRESMNAAEVGVLLVTNPLDVAYLTGFLGGDSYALITPSKFYILSDFRLQEELEHLHPSAKFFSQVIIRKGTMTACVAETLSSIGSMSSLKVGIQAEAVTLSERDALAAACKCKPTDFISTRSLIAKLRVCKDASEVELIRKAVAIQQAALKSILPNIKPGLTEAQVAADLEAEMKRRGSPRPAFESIVAAQANGSLPHYRPKPGVKLLKNQPLLIDFGAIFQGYHSDMTRTFTLGKWPEKVREIYQIVLEAHERAAAALAPGKPCKHIDSIARSYITDRGYGDKFGHGLGHGIGLQIHEDPRLSHMAGDGELLKPGMVVTIEPGIYLPGIGGVRIEDDYLITEKGAENLCSLPKSLSWSTL